MRDTFGPAVLTKKALAMDDAGYPFSRGRIATSFRVLLS